MKLNDLRKQLTELKQKEVIAQTRESLLNEEKEKLLDEIRALYAKVDVLKLLPESELTPQNLSVVISKIKDCMEKDIADSAIPADLV